MCSENFYHVKLMLLRMEITTKKTALSALLALALSAGFTGCSDRFDLDDDGNRPGWLGQSIYDELKNPSSGKLDGTFNTVIRLVDDLGYAETLSKTGSKTVFVANDEAYESFFKNNPWGVSSYEQLSLAQKKQLLFGAMLDNAMLVEMFSNVPSGDDADPIQGGVALKHAAGLSVIDTITYVAPNGELPANNTYWDYYRDKGIHMVQDATQPMLVHFTADQMYYNDITTDGGESDFAVITGFPYNQSENSAFVFRNKIKNADVICQNGYVHQLENVLVLPGNLAEVIRTNGSSDLFSRMLDRFSAPVYDAVTTRNYNAFAQENGLATIDSIFQKRYFSSRSQGGLAFNKDPYGATVREVLPFDPGWNQYTGTVPGANALSDLCTIFVPNDEAMTKYFLPGGSGAFIMEQYGKKENTPENLKENIDSIPKDIVQAFLDNLMHPSFNASVPSKFGSVMDDASDPMGLELGVISKDDNGVYDVKIANNGVAYMLNTVFAPNRYQAVSAPALLNSSMRVMNEAINDGDGKNYLNLNQNFYAYLLAMKANYAFFIPTDLGFRNFYYVDPSSLAHDADKNSNRPPRVLRFYFDSKKDGLMCSQWRYDPVRHEVGDSIGEVTPAAFRTQLIDILNYHTIVLKSPEVDEEGNEIREQMGERRFYKTKHGGAVIFDNNKTITATGLNANGADRANIQKVYNQKNGTTYAIDRVIQAPTASVYSVLRDNDQFSEFLALCTDANMDSYMEFASDRLSELNPVTRKRRMNAYHAFVNNKGLTDNVNYFNSYNYTVYAPDNDAMQIAYRRGLPKWSDVAELYDKWVQYTEDGLVKWSALLDPDNTKLTTEQKQNLQNDRNAALAKVEAINAFTRYHFQDNSIFADNIVDADEYATANANDLGVRMRLKVSGGGGQIVVQDATGQQVVVKEDGQRIVNKLTRDYVFDNAASSATAIRTSSFAVVHQINTPLNYDENASNSKRYDGLWTGSNAKKKLAAFRQKFDTYLYKRY